MDNVHFIYILGTEKDLKTTPPAPEFDDDVRNRSYSELLLQLSPYEKKVANRYLIQWQDNSTRYSNYFSRKIKSHAEEWEVLISSWNTPLQVPEPEQPYHYQEHKQDQKLSSLRLEHSLKMMDRDVENLYWKYYYEYLNFQFRDCITSLMPHKNDTPFLQIQQLLQAHKNESLYYTRAFMLAKLHNTKKSIDKQLQTSYHALNESIYVERGLYYDTLHPDKKYTINIKRTEYKSISKKMKEIWIDWPHAHIKRTELMTYRQRFHAVLQKAWGLCLHTVRRWREIRRAQMRRFLYRIHYVQSRFVNIRMYLFA
ncbi:hypothetical protein [Parasitella parasitica]|uniref:Uncharacterized protein n=1 Tax=Parasitella parasitica TaxID=35722 RepID=A0A0B7NQR3_9FUNG|nr:hypothetical protein [Parasitella parasitica]